MIKLTNVSKAYLLSQKEVELLKGEDYFYVGNSTATIITDINTIQVLTKRLFSIVGIALFIGILLTIYLLMAKYVKVFSRSSGILITCGISKKRLIQAPLYSIADALFLCFINSFYNDNKRIFRNRLYYLKLDFSAVLVLELFIISMLFIIIMTTLFFIYILRKIRRNTIREFLTTQVL